MLSFVVLSVVSAAIASPLSTPNNAAGAGRSWTLAPLIRGDHPHGSLNDSYIVVFKPEAQALHVQNHMNFLAAAHDQSFLGADLTAGLRQVYDGHVRGYAGKFAPTTVEAIRAMPEVEYIEHDQLVHTTDKHEHETQNSAPWVSTASFVVA
jgi:cerevisin